MLSAHNLLFLLGSVLAKKGVGILLIRKHTNSTLNISTQKVHMSKQAKTLNERELQRLLDFVKTTKNATRNRAILLLTHFSGMRIGEVAAVRLCDVLEISKWITEHTVAGLLPQEFGVFVRSGAQIKRAEAAVAKAGLKFKVLDEHVETTSGFVSISTMHLAKGLEFRAVFVMACDDEVVPLQERCIEAIGDDADIQEVYDTERHLLYVACTRARDFLTVSGVNPSSEFLDDFRR